jgi:hypothetical protein
MSVLGGGQPYLVAEVIPHAREDMADELMPAAWDPPPCEIRHAYTVRSVQGGRWLYTAPPLCKARRMYEALRQQGRAVKFQVYK